MHPPKAAVLRTIPNRESRVVVLLLTHHNSKTSHNSKKHKCFKSMQVKTYPCTPPLCLYTGCIRKRM